MEPARSAVRQWRRVRLFSAAEESEVSVVEGVGGNGLDEGDLVAHLVELALGALLVEQDEVGRGERRIGEDVFQFPANQGGGSGDGDFVHRQSFT